MTAYADSKAWQDVYHVPHGDLHIREVHDRRRRLFSNLVQGKMTMPTQASPSASALPPPRQEGIVATVRSPSRPERHFVDSFITVRLAIALFLARWLPRCPLCHQPHEPSRCTIRHIIRAAWFLAVVLTGPMSLRTGNPEGSIAYREVSARSGIHD